MNVSYRIFLLLEELCDTVRRRGSIVTTYGNQKLDVVLGKEVEVEVFLEIFCCRFETTHLKVATTSVKVSVCLEEVDVLDARVL